MTLWQIALPAVAGAAAAGMLLRSTGKKRKQARQRDFARRLETVLLPRETVKAQCGKRGKRCVLTSKRLLFETKTGFRGMQITQISRVYGLNQAGNRTTSPDKMVKLVIRGEQDYELQNTGTEFRELAAALMEQVKKQKEKKKEKDRKKGQEQDRNKGNDKNREKKKAGAGDGK